MLVRLLQSAVGIIIYTTRFLCQWDSLPRIPDPSHFDQCLICLGELDIFRQASITPFHIQDLESYCCLVSPLLANDS